MTIEEFLTKHIEGYLLCDLEKMAEIKLEPPETYGAVGYPMIATVLSGIELLGGILSINSFDKNGGNEYFDNYWKNYLSKSCSRYEVENLAPLFRNLVRHGLAHTFLAKPGILVTKDASDTHLQIDTQRQELSIDSVEFYRDFKKSYTEQVRPIVFEQPASILTTKDNMQARLNEMEKVYSEDSSAFFSRLPQQSSQTLASGASTSVTRSVKSTRTTFTP